MMEKQPSRNRSRTAASRTSERRPAAARSTPRRAPSAPAPSRATSSRAGARTAKAREVFAILRRTHPDATIELRFSNPLELLIATILSAQCTDMKVNQVTVELFRRYKTPKDYLAGTAAELESIIRPTGFFKQKAKNIRGAMKLIIDRHSGAVPKTMEELVQLPGVGRKTANVVLGNAFDLPGLPVDTHVRRVSNRLGLTEQDDPVKIESELCALLPSEDWCMFSHTLIFHGRRICKARKPNCEGCTVLELCDHPHPGGPSAPRVSTPRAKPPAGSPHRKASGSAQRRGG